MIAKSDVCELERKAAAHRHVFNKPVVFENPGRGLVSENGLIEVIQTGGLDGSQWKRVQLQNLKSLHQEINEMTIRQKGAPGRELSSTIIRLEAERSSRVPCSVQLGQYKELLAIYRRDSFTPSTLGITHLARASLFCSSLCVLKNWVFQEEIH